jgi:hypothetical protein
MSVGKLIRKGLPFSNVAANSIATVQIMPGRTIEGIQINMVGTGLTLSSLAASSVGLIRLKANGKIFYEATGHQVDKMARFQGLTYPAASATNIFLPIMFTEIFGRDLLDEMVGAFDTSSGIQNITMEMNIGTVTTITTCEIYLLESAPQNQAVSPVMLKVLRYPFAVAAGGGINIPLPFGEVSGSIIKRIHMEHAVANNITAVNIKENGVVVHESTKLVNDAVNQLFRAVNQQAATPFWYSVDMIADENIKNAMDTRKDRTLELVPTFAAADSGFVIVEYLDTLGNL